MIATDEIEFDMKIHHLNENPPPPTHPPLELHLPPNPSYIHLKVYRLSSAAQDIVSFVIAGAMLYAVRNVL